VQSWVNAVGREQALATAAPGQRVRSVGDVSMIREVQPGEGALVAEVLHELRPHCGVDEIPELIDAQRAEGYRVVGSFVDDVVVAAAGFRLSTNLALGRAIYIDDLVTLPRARGAGHAGALLEWVATEAVRLGCSHVHLDSATHRHPAHRLYLAASYDITAFHFVRSV
jgi:GNAT superfamily N-acetyltransferase